MNDIVVIEDRNKKVWDTIKSITKDRTCEEDPIILAQDGRELNTSEGKKELIDFWQKVHTTEKGEYNLIEEAKGQKWDEKQERIQQIYDEHNYCRRPNVWNKRPQIDKQEVLEAIMGLKNNKSAGPDGMKAEMYKFCAIVI